MNGLGQKCSYFLNAFLIKWRNDVRDYKLEQYHEITNPRYLNIIEAKIRSDAVGTKYGLDFEKL